jgi:hypothetical protein
LLSPKRLQKKINAKAGSTVLRETKQSTQYIGAPQPANSIADLWHLPGQLSSQMKKALKDQIQYVGIIA